MRIKEAAKADNGAKTIGVEDVPPSEWFARGVVVPPPAYEERVYNTQYSMPSNIEKYMYHELL